MLGYGSSLCRSMVRHRWCIRKSATGHGWCVKPTIAITLLQQSGPPSLTWQKNVFLFWVLLGLLCFSVLGQPFYMALFLHFCVLGFWGQPIFYVHVKNVHPRASLVSQASQIVLFLQLYFPPVLHLSFILFTSWAWFRDQFNFILGCLKLVSRAFICFIGSLKPSKTRLGKFFAYPLTELLKI